MWNLSSTSRQVFAPRASPTNLSKRFTASELWHVGTGTPVPVTPNKKKEHSFYLGVERAPHLPQHEKAKGSRGDHGPEICQSPRIGLSTHRPPGISGVLVTASEADVPFGYHMVRTRRARLALAGMGLICLCLGLVEAKSQFDQISTSKGYVHRVRARSLHRCLRCSFRASNDRSLSGNGPSGLSSSRVAAPHVLLPTRPLPPE